MVYNYYYKFIKDKNMSYSLCLKSVTHITFHHVISPPPQPKQTNWLRSTTKPLKWPQRRPLTTQQYRPRKKQSPRRGFTWPHPGRWSRRSSWTTHRHRHKPPCPRRSPGSWWRDRPWRSRDHHRHQHLENRLDTRTEPWYTGAMLG